MADGSAAKIEDAWVFLEEQELEAEQFRPWAELLGEEKNLRGLQRIVVESFGGRSGWRELAEHKCSNEDGESVRFDQTAKLNAGRIAREAWQACTKDHRRNARDVYRMQLYVVRKRNGAEEPGERVTLRWGEEGGELDGRDGNAVLNAALVKTVCGLLIDQRKFLHDLLTVNVQMAQAATGTALHGVQAIHTAGEITQEAQAKIAAVQRGPTAEDVNRRLETVMNRVGPALETLANAAAPGIAAWARGMGGARGPSSGPSSSSSSSSSTSSGPTSSSSSSSTNGKGNGHAPHAEDGQRKAQTFFDGLSGEQKDRLRDAMGPEKFTACAEVIHGHPSGWEVDADYLRTILMQHMNDLRQILTPEQFGALVELS